MDNNYFHDKKYEWVGSFWFPNEEDKPFSGILEYTPEKGLSLNCASEKSQILIKLPSKKMMYGHVKDKNKDHSYDITLLNVAFVSSNGKAIAESLIFNTWLEEYTFNRLDLEYDEQFMNIFAMPMRIKQSILSLSNENKMMIDSETSVCAGHQTTSEFIINTNEIDTIFSCNNVNKLDELKKSFQSIIFDDTDTSLGRIKSLSLFLSFNRNDSILNDILPIERNWRFYWEFIIDNPIPVKRVWLMNNDKNSFPTLISRFKNEGGSIKRKPHLAINWDSFNKEALDISLLEDVFVKWIDIQNAPEWSPVIHGMKKYILCQHQPIFAIGDPASYVALISEIETFINITTDIREHEVKELLQNHSFEEWNNELIAILDIHDTPEEMITYLYELRNVITHPKAQKGKKIKYWDITTDEFKLQKIYAYLGGLLMKAILIHVGGLDASTIEKHTMNMIKQRASWAPFRYED